MRPHHALMTCVVGLVSVFLSAPTSATPLQDRGQTRVQISAQVDRTTVELGGRLTLTITVSAGGGSAPQVELKPFEFPKAFRVVAQSRSTNLSMEFGEVRRSISLVYALAPLEPGRFTLGPFEVSNRGQSLLTDPLEIVVNKPALPPTLAPSKRFVL